MLRRSTFFFLTFLPLVLLLGGCGGGDKQSDQTNESSETNRNLLVGNWLGEQTSYHYLGKEDRVEVPSDSTWFAFELIGVSIFTQRIQGAYHKQLYSWNVTDSTLILTSDIQLNTGTFQFVIADSSFEYTRQLESMTQDSLTGWTYTYRRVDE
jgi:hypothetical protein